APAWRRPRPGANDADLRRFALCVGRRDTSSAERRQPGTRRVEGVAARHRIHRSRSARAAWHSRTKVTTPCMSASFTPCLTSAVARAPETPVVLRLLPPRQTGGCPALRTDSLRGRHTDQHRLLLQYHRLHGSL